VRLLREPFGRPRGFPDTPDLKGRPRCFANCLQALEQIINDGDDKRFEPRGRCREALNAIKTLAQQTGRGWFQHCPCYTRSPDPPSYLRDPCQTSDWKEAWRLRLALVGGAQLPQFAAHKLW